MDQDNQDRLTETESEEDFEELLNQSLNGPFTSIPVIKLKLWSPK